MTGSRMRTRSRPLHRGPALVTLALGICVVTTAAAQPGTAARLSDLSAHLGANTAVAPGTARALVRAAGPGGPVELVSFDRRTRTVTARQSVALACERVHAAAAGLIACMRYNRALSGASQVDLFDRTLTLLHPQPIQSNAVISRTRVSADGRYTATTVFVSGHSYAVPGQFSTLSHIWDSRERRMALAFDKLTLTHEGQVVPYTPHTQVNYWGASFDPRDADRFYVTVSIRKRPYLAEGRISQAAVRTLRPDVECPSVSPDGTRIAFKKLRANRRGWDPAVLDLRSGTETVYPAAKGLDDQIEWLDDQALVYEATETVMGGAKTHLMLLDLSQAKPTERLWLADAASPALVSPVLPLR